MYCLCIASVSVSVAAESTIHVTFEKASSRRSDNRLEGTAAVAVDNSELFNTTSFGITSVGGGPDYSDRVVFKKTHSTIRTLKNGKIEVTWHGGIIDNGRIGFATILLTGNGDLVATFSTQSSVFELDTLPNGILRVKATLWKDVVDGEGIEPGGAKLASTPRMANARFNFVGSFDPDQSGSVTTSSVNGVVAKENSKRGNVFERSAAINTIVDILILVTNRAMCEVAGLANNCVYNTKNAQPIRNKISLAILQTNTAMLTVEIPVSMRIVRIVHLSSDFETTQVNPGEDVLEFLRLDKQIRQLRDEAGADLVSLLTGGLPSGFPSAGIAYIDSAESVTSTDALATYTFTHEIGKIFFMLAFINLLLLSSLNLHFLLDRS